MKKLNLKLRRKISYLLLPAMILFSFSAFAKSSYDPTQSAFANGLGISNPPSFSENYGSTSKQQSSTINNLPLTINENPFKYSGYYCDPRTGLYYLHARYYSPVLMRFINRDTCDLPNRYAYCNGQPVSEIDPTGHMSTGTIFGFIGDGLAVIGGILAIGFSGGLTTGAVVTGVLSITSGTTGVISGVEYGMGKGHQQTSATLGYVSFGTGLASCIAGGVSARIASNTARRVAAEAAARAAEEETERLAALEATLKAEEDARQAEYEQFLREEEERAQTLRAEQEATQKRLIEESAERWNAMLRERGMMSAVEEAKEVDKVPEGVFYNDLVKTEYSEGSEPRVVREPPGVPKAVEPEVPDNLNWGQMMSFWE